MFLKGGVSLVSYFGVQSLDYGATSVVLLFEGGLL